jgi:hypothetical protein
MGKSVINRQENPALTNGKTNGKNRLDRIEELLNMAAAQTAENAKELGAMRKEFRDELRLTATEHNREMKEIRSLFKDMIKRIAV